MKILMRLIIVVLVSFVLSLKAHADAVATLYGTIKDANGKAIQGAEIRIQGSDANKIGKIHTDANGHYSYPGLETGTYNVTLVVNGVTVASINNVRTKNGESQSLNFDFQSKAGARPFAKGKHYVWVPSQTGSHLGAWVEVDDSAKEMPIGMQERMRWSGSALARQLQDKGSAMPNTF
jgi:Carboxypeptidase regulatory-like domain